MRICLQCRHCMVNLGSVAYSDLTPGGPGSFECARGRFAGEPETGFGTAEAWAMVQQAASCPEFELAEWAEE